jgi:hypothetical protein
VLMTDRSGKLLFNATGAPGVSLSSDQFESRDPVFDLDVTAFGKSSGAARLQGRKTLFVPPKDPDPGGFGSIGTAIVESVGILLSVSVRPVVKSTTFTIGFAGTPFSPDRDDLDRQMKAVGITSDNQIGDPDFSLIAGGFKATVRFFTGDLAMTQVIR